jgi:2-dehydropantoate 2-reductase
MLRMPTFLVRLLARAQMKVDPEARSSMYQDLSRGRKTEVDYLNGEIVALADRHGIDAPLNRRIVELVRRAEAAGAGSPTMAPDELWSSLHG